MMKIAFIHYHLNIGGVTTVINQQVNALKDDCELLLLTGEPPPSGLSAQAVYIPGIGYDNKNPTNKSPDAIADAVINAISEKWKDGCDVLHVHNPYLAKNKHFLTILRCLQDNHMNLFLQLHDFAEDGRPGAYFSKDEYIRDCHYGVINQRDYIALLRAGLKQEGVHKIFNTVTPFKFKKNIRNPDNTVLYPVRAIRRKNIGEAILLSLFFSNNETLAITRPPNSPSDMASYNGWKRFAADNNLHVEFDASSERTFEDLVLSSKFFITTSIAEGFGFTFLEPWTAGKFLWGRKLPDICVDFEQNGIRLDHLYNRLIVPIEWIGKEYLRERWKASVLNACTRFNMSKSAHEIETAFEALTEDNTIDFGMLDEAFQKQVVLQLLTDKKKKDTIIGLNPEMSYINELSNADISLNNDVIESNRAVITACFNESRYKNRLMDIYAKAANNRVSHGIDKKALLSGFLNLETFSLLKWGEYIE